MMCLGMGISLSLLTGCTTQPRSSAVSDHYAGERFYNATPLPDVGLFKLLKHIITGRSTPWPDLVPNDPAPRLDLRLPAEQVAVTFINHATVLIQWRNQNILTDPVWSTRVGPFSWAGPKRVRAPGVAFEDLPRIDAVLISHNHYDHLDLPTLRKLEARDQPRFYVPLGDAHLLESEDFQSVTELDWWDRVRVNAEVELIFTPAQHNSGRGIFDARRSLWGSFLIQLGGEHRIYFAGDTAYSDHFREIRRRLGAPDLALLPIGAYAPRQQMRPYHMDPADAVQAQSDLAAPLSVALHFGTFQLTNETYTQPLTDLTAALRNAGQPAESFVYLGEGRTTVLNLTQ